MREREKKEKREKEREQRVRLEMGHTQCKLEIRQRGTRMSSVVVDIDSEWMQNRLHLKEPFGHLSFFTWFILSSSSLFFSFATGITSAKTGFLAL